MLGGDYDFAKVLDFGLVLDRHPTSEELEDEQRLVGTPAVMPPEMVRFHAPVDARADIYALGCVGYWLLTGRRVFEAGTRHDMLVMHAHQKPIAPSKRTDLAIHPGLEGLVMACLEKNPNRRPQTARELSEMLSSLSFTPAWNDERARLWWQRHHPERRVATLPADEPASPPAQPRSGERTNEASV
jgi:serine/threonine-protein kinase